MVAELNNSMRFVRRLGLVGVGAARSILVPVCLGVAFASMSASGGTADLTVTGVQTNTVSPLIRSEYFTNGLYVNFRGAPLNLVLDFLSDAAGFIINRQTDVRGTVEVWSERPVTKDEAVELLGSVLKKSGYGINRNGRVLTILSLDAVKTADTEIVVGNNPIQVAKSAEVQTQVIPVRYASATQLLANLQQLLPTSASLSANESANTLILVASKTDIQRVLKIIDALDRTLATGSTIQVHSLRYAKAKDAADLISKLFSQQTSGQTPNSSGPNFFGGPPDAGMAGASQGTGDNVATRRNAVLSKVIAVADERSNAVVLSAPADLLANLTNILNSIDHPVTDSTELRVFRLKNADPDELADQLLQLYPKDNSSNATTDGMPMMFSSGPGPAGQSGDDDRAGSNGIKRTGSITAVSDPRSSSLIISASKTVMPQIAKIIQTLDADAGKREVVSYFELSHADPQDISQNLQELFNRSTRMNNNNQNSFLGRNNPLTQRQTQTQQSSTSDAFSFGSSSSSGTGSSRSGP